MNCFSDITQEDVEEIKIELTELEDVAASAESVSFCVDKNCSTDACRVIKEEEEEDLITVTVAEKDATEVNIISCASSEINDDFEFNREQPDQANVVEGVLLSTGNDHDSQTSSFEFFPSSNLNVTEFNTSSSLLSRPLTVLSLNQQRPLLSACSSELQHEINLNLGPQAGPTTSMVYSNPLYFGYGTYVSLQSDQSVLPSNGIPFSSICFTERFATEQPLEQCAVMLRDEMPHSSNHFSKLWHKTDSNSDFKIYSCEQEIINSDTLNLEPGLIDSQLGLGIEMPFSCTDCPEKFYTEQLLKLHSVIHSNQKPFSNFPSPSVRRRIGRSVQLSKKKPLLRSLSSKSRRKVKLNVGSQKSALPSSVISNCRRTQVNAFSSLQDDQSLLVSGKSRSSKRMTRSNVDKLDLKLPLSTSSGNSVRRSNRLNLSSESHLGKLQSCRTGDSLCAPSQSTNCNDLCPKLDSNQESGGRLKYSTKLKHRICSSISETKLESSSSTKICSKLKREPLLNVTKTADLKALSNKSGSRHTARFKSKKMLFSCPKCTIECKTKNTLKNHLLRTHSKKKKLSCRFCSSKFRTKLKRKRHIASCHALERPYLCAHCPATFKERHGLRRHGKIHSTERPFLCEICAATFKTAVRLRNHSYIHLTEKKFTCAHCSVKFKSKKPLKRHILIHSEERVFHCCDICGAKFTIKGNLVKHFKKHYMSLSELKPFFCLHCDTRFYDKTSMMQHSVVHSGEKAFSCQHCDATFSRKSSMLRHAQVAHNINTNPDCKELPVKTLISCDVCSATFRCKSSLMSHVRVHSDERPFSCPECAATFKRQGDVQQHLAVHLNDKPFLCEHCPATFKSRTNLKHHLRTHSTDKPFSCPHCSYTSKFKGDLKKHEVVHSNARPFQCPSCPAAFKTKGTLLKHSVFHSTEKSYACEYCAATFYNLTNLKRHLLVHSDEKPFSCKYCAASFKSKRQVEVHMATHTNEKPFGCKLCGASFVLKSYLTQHLIVHSNAKQFACQHCSATFKTKGHLKNHLVIHSTEKPYSCPECAISFKTKGQLKTHIITHSSEKMFPCQLCASTFKSKGQLKTHTMTHSKEKMFPCQLCASAFKTKGQLKTHSKTHLKKEQR